MRQNDNVGQDDRFYVTIDPFNDRRSGYFFGLNPNGVRARRAVSATSPSSTAIGTRIYDAAAGRFEGGWTAEIEIPYKSISFDPTHRHVGAQLLAHASMRKSETSAWVSRNRAYNPAVSGLDHRLRRAWTRASASTVVPSLSVSDAQELSDGRVRARDIGAVARHGLQASRRS